MVTLYSKKSCAPCVGVKRYLDKKGVDYVEKDIELTANAMELQWATGMLSAPTVVDGDFVVVGPNYGKLAKLA